MRSAKFSKASTIDARGGITPGVSPSASKAEDEGSKAACGRPPTRTETSCAMTALASTNGVAEACCCRSILGQQGASHGVPFGPRSGLSAATCTRVGARCESVIADDRLARVREGVGGRASSKRRSSWEGDGSKVRACAAEGHAFLSVGCCGSCVSWVLILCGDFVWSTGE